MSDDRFVYVVTAGEYSDYHIVAVFDNEQAATEYAASHVRHDGGVEAYSLNAVAPIAVTYVEVTITDATDGLDSWRFGKPHVMQTHDWLTLRAESPTAWYWDAKQRGDRAMRGAYYARAVGLDEEHARKSAQDAMYRFRAEREGIA